MKHHPEQLVQVAAAVTGAVGKPHDRRVVINVGGDRHETMLSTLRRLPDTRLSLLAHLQEADDSYDVNTNEFFFDRNPKVFGVIMHYVRTQELHIDHSLCGNVIKPELAFWGVEEQEIEACCWAEYSKFTEHRDALRHLDENFTSFVDDNWGEERSTCKRFADAAWRFLEEPTSSRGAKVYAVVSMFFVVLSISIFVLETHKLFQVDEKSGLAMNVLLPDDTLPTGGISVKCCCNDGNMTGEGNIFSPTTHPVLKILDYICAGFFLVEVIVRFSVAPRKGKFWRDPLNVIDVVCLIPHFTAITLGALNYVNSSAFPIKPFMVLRVVRILRIFKLMKHYSAFKILAYTIKVSTKELLLMIVFLMTGVLMFASIIHYVERHNFPNIPIAIWWAVVTMTTVGYGDKYPVDYGGYIVGCACVISGVLVIAFTVPIVVNNFSLYYSHAQTRIKLPQKKRRKDTGKPSQMAKLGSRPTEAPERSSVSASGDFTSNSTSVSMISNCSQSDSVVRNNLNITEVQPPDRKVVPSGKQAERTPHGKLPTGRVITPVDDLDIDAMLQQEIQAKSDQMIKQLHTAEEKRDLERKRQEFKLKIRREERLKSKVASKWKMHKNANIDAKESEDIAFVNKD